MARRSTRSKAPAAKTPAKKSAKAEPSSSPYLGDTQVHSPPTKPTPKTPASSSKKRKLVDLTQDDGQETPSTKSDGKKSKTEQPEKRLKTFRPKAPQSFLQKLERAQTQRMIVIGRTRSGSGSDLQETIDIVGTTGNIYTVTIGRLPSCTCPDHLKGNECKHKVYALSTVLRAPYDLQYQRAFLTEEVQEILSGAPPIPDITGDAEEDHDGKRKPIEGECPICYMDYDPDNNELVWCKAACGNNMHKTCFEQWAASQRGQEVRCVYCRTPWQMEKGDVEAIKRGGEESGDGYVNVAEQFGINRGRDYSSYHQHWVRRTIGYGW